MSTAPIIPELLAPAGSPLALRAAVNNGADAVYLGLDRLNARQGAENFAIETLAEATRFAHLKGVRVYLTANVVVLPDEMDDALHLIDQAWAAGVDAVIVQDLGLARLISVELPHVRMHASTQMNTHNTATVAEVKRLGLSRITLAREVSRVEATTLAASTDLEIEVFVHGALCMCYSGQCLLSSLIGRRSANRGTCAQPCRLPYELLDERSRVRETPGPHLLSPKDLCSIDTIPELVASGVAALKIEGRMKDPEYVALVTGVYRAALDRFAAAPDSFAVTSAERSVLQEAFSRGFSPAYLEDIRDNSMMSYTRPNNRGVHIGRISKIVDRDVHISLDGALDTEDIIEVWTSRGRFAQKVGRMDLSGSTVSTGPSGSTVVIRTEKPASVGDRVFRVVNATLLSAARRTYAEDRGGSALPVDVSVRLVLGSPLRVELKYGDKVGVAEGPIVEQARTKSVTAEEVTEHIGRFGGTLFDAAAWNIELQPGVGIGFSALHHARREAVEDLERVMLKPWAHRELRHPRPQRAGKRRAAAPVAPQIVVRTDDLVTARACVGAGAQRVIMPHWALIDVPAEEIPERVAVELPRIAHDREVDDLVLTARREAERVPNSARMVVGNLGLLGLVAETGCETDAHWSLNAVNQWTCEALSDSGASMIWLSPELSGRQITEVAAASPVPVGIAVYGRQEVMVTEHCVLMSIGECNQICGTCPRRRSWHALRDRKGYTFPVSTDPLGRSHVFNSVPLDLTRAAGEIVSAGIAEVRLDFTVEHSQEAQKITRIVREAFAAAIGDREIEEEAVEQGTTGHFYRGVY